MTAQLSEYTTSETMADDENGGGSSDSGGGGDESVAVIEAASATAERVVMIAFKMENDEDDDHTLVNVAAAGPSAIQQRDIKLEQMVQKQTPPSSFLDGNTAGIIQYTYYNLVMF